jgi:hypothetical protein
MLRTLLKWGGIALLVIAAVWISVILWWNATNRVISMSDVVLYLAVLPAFLFFSIVLIQFFRMRAKKKAEAANNPSDPSSSENKPAAELDPLEAEKKIRLPIVGAWGTTSLADNAKEFVTALSEKRSRPRPDGQLLDRQGYPLPSGRVPSLDIEDVRDRLMQAIAKKNMGNVADTEEWRDAFLRTLALLDQVIDQVHNDWPLQFESFAEIQVNQSIGTLRGAPQARARKNDTLTLQVKLLLTTEFKPYEKQLALAYLFEKILLFQIPNEHIHIEVISGSDDATALGLMDKFSVNSHRNATTEALLLLASDSTLCPTVVEDWQSAGKLFTQHSPSGLMLGEAAFGVLCVSSKALLATKIEPQCHMARVTIERRDTSADLHGKPSSVCLTGTVKQAITTADLTGEKIGTVACDADHRTNRTLECLGAMMNETPHLDAIDNRLSANEACGHMGAASVMGALVAGIMQAQQAGHPILVFNVSHMIERAATVLLPNSAMPEPS